MSHVVQGMNIDDHLKFDCETCPGGGGTFIVK